ncbi:hypothetical protein CHUAL_009508 [Chamberlinius hualienensis]
MGRIWFYFLLCMSYDLVGGGRRMWKPNTNFDNPDNWDIGRIPNCPNDKVIFENVILNIKELEESFSVAITNSVAINSVILARNAELILPVDSTFDIGRNLPSKCRGKVANFVASDVTHWFDPVNWRTDLNSDELAIPHSEKVPCKYDVVIFPPNSTFKVIIEGIEAECSSFKINDKDLSGEMFSSYVETPNGRNQFKSKYEKVASYVYRSHDKKIIVVFVDKETPRRSQELVKNIQTTLQKEDQLSYLDVDQVSVEVSSKWSDGPEALQRQLAGGLSGGGVTALIFGLMAAIIIAVLFYINRHRLMPLAFPFGRFVNEDDTFSGLSGFELAQPATEIPIDEKSLKLTNETASVSFENPFFSQEVSDVAVQEKGENPGYMPYERVEDVPSTNDEVDDIKK